MAKKKRGGGERVSRTVVRLRFLLAALAILVVTSIVYSPALKFDFVSWDDGAYVAQNPEVLKGFSPQTLGWAFLNQTPYWHPVTWMSHLLDVTVLGPGPHGMHTVNIVIHLANCALLLILLERLTRRTALAASATMLFALHPLHVESVAWISERKDLLSTFFVLLAFIAYHRYTKIGSRSRYAVVVVAFCLSLMSKPMFVTFPVLLLLLDYWPLARFGSARSILPLLIEKIPLAFLSGLSAVVTYIGQQQTGTMAKADALSMGARVANALVSYVAYLRKTAWPTDLAAFYPYPVNWWSGSTLIVCSLVLISITALVFAFRRQRPYLLFGWLWYLLALLPAIGLVQVGNQAMADRFTYAPLIGVFVAAVWTTADVAPRWKNGRSVLGLFGSVILVSCVVSTRAQLLTWSDSLALWSRVLAVSPDSYYAHSALGDELATRGQSDAARGHQEEALRLRPTDPDAHNSLGILEAERGNLEAATRHFSAALQLNPAFAEAALNLGTAFVKSGRPADAIAAFRQASELLPQDANARRLLGEALMGVESWAEAVDVLRPASDMEPNSAVIHFDLGFALDQMDRRQEAIIHYESAIAVDKSFAEAYSRLGTAYARTNDIEHARRAFEAAVSLAPTRPDYRSNLALAYLRLGRSQEAMREIETGLRGTPDDRNLLALRAAIRRGR